MVSNWNPLKRHGELFRTLGEIQRKHGRRLRVALIGYPAGWTRQDIERLAAQHGVAESCTMFEGIPPDQVAAIVADSRAYVLLSRREGANRALYEAIFCNTPIVVHRRHRGVNTDHVLPEVGVLFEDGGLAEAILTAVDNPGRFAPRRWALGVTGYANATRRINEAARACALARGLPWTRDITAKKNIPNLRYARACEYQEFAEEYRRLERYLLPVD
jgi:glycosyltransferase involved in cell wall biosynthesis